MDLLAIKKNTVWSTTKHRRTFTLPPSPGFKSMKNNKPASNIETTIITHVLKLERILLTLKPAAGITELD